ncbi:MAG: alpha/beta hydrolase [Proteobacteria bacterium]|nr:alpha/beta hydrolase [Pseudomonadota bacterium]
MATDASATLDAEPFWAGSPQRPLYAALHGVAAPAPLGIVLAPPLLAEQPRSRRLLMQIAEELAAKGLPCLRFDYFGTGDSAGAGTAHDVAAMHTDFDTVVAALRERAGVARVAVIAWRGAALVAADWSARDGNIDALVLWEPVTDGAAWLAELEAGDRAERTLRARRAPDIAADGQLFGFPASSSWRRGIAALALDTREVRKPVWTVQRQAAGAPPAGSSRCFMLPAGTPHFDGATTMDATLFLSRPLRVLVDELANALTSAAP